MFGTDEGTKERRRRLIATMGRAEEGREGEERKVEGDARWMDGTDEMSEGREAGKHIQVL